MMIRSQQEGPRQQHRRRSTVRLAQPRPLAALGLVAMLAAAVMFLGHDARAQQRRPTPQRKSPPAQIRLAPQPSPADRIEIRTDLIGAKAAADAGVTITAAEPAAITLGVLEPGPTIVTITGTGLRKLNQAELVRQGEPVPAYAAYRAINDTRAEVELRASPDTPGGGSFSLRLSNQGAGAPQVRNQRDLMNPQPQPDDAFELAMILTVPGVQVRVTDPANFFRANRPKLVVLMHGASPHPDDPADPTKGMPQTDRLAFARYYFGHEWVRRLLGAGSGDTINTFDGVPLDADNYVTQAGTDRTSPWPSHFLAVGHELGAGTTPEFDPASPPKLMVMLHDRDASRDIMTQARQAIDQIYDAYTATFTDPDQQPQIILIGHSMGGLCARTILSNPSEPIPLNGSPVRLDESHRRKADFIRNRTMYLVTLATPHEGSVEPGIIIDQHTLLDQMACPPWLAPLFAAIGHPPPTVGELIAVIEPMGVETLEKERNRPSVIHLTQAFWRGLNRGLLRPENAKRTFVLEDGDTGQVPVYALIGRSPGGGWFDDPALSDWTRMATAAPNPQHLDHTGVVRALDAEADGSSGAPQGIDTIRLNTFPDNRTAADTIGLVMLDQVLVRMANPRGSWGDPGDHADVLDRVQRMKTADFIPLYGGYLEAEVERLEARAEAQGGGNIVEQVAGAIGNTVDLTVARARLAAFQAASGSGQQLQRLRELAQALGVVLPPTVFEQAADRDVPAYLSRRWDLVPQDDGTAVWRARANSNRATDGEVDNDGMVGTDSGLGFWLGGTTPKPFDHTTGGSWYRIESGPWDLTNHATICTDPAVGQWLRDNLVARAVGPIPSREGFSRYPAADPITLPIAAGDLVLVRDGRLANIPVNLRDARPLTELTRESPERPSDKPSEDRTMEPVRTRQPLPQPGGTTSRQPLPQRDQPTLTRPPAQQQLKDQQAAYIVTLRNGRKIEAVSVEKTARGYVVTTTDGRKVTLRAADVRQVEEAGG